MSKLDRLNILTEQCDICSQSATEDFCCTCEKLKEIRWLEERMEEDGGES